jgi:hypothetical protein
VNRYSNILEHFLFFQVALDILSRVCLHYMIDNFFVLLVKVHFLRTWHCFLSLKLYFLVKVFVPCVDRFGRTHRSKANRLKLCKFPVYKYNLKLLNVYSNKRKKLNPLVNLFILISFLLIFICPHTEIKITDIIKLLLAFSKILKNLFNSPL